MNSCEVCRFYEPKDPLKGECRKEPPTVFIVPVQGVGGITAQSISGFPGVANDNWCGSWAVKV